MSEFQFTPNKEPKVRLNLPTGETFISTRHNTEIYHYLGNLAVFNHIDCNNKEELGLTMRVFNFSPVYKKFLKYVIANSYPMRINLPEVSDEVSESYLKSCLIDSDVIPDWME